MKYPLLIAMVGVIAFSCQKEAETHTVGERQLSEAVYASGEVMPSEYYFMKASTTDRLLKILVKDEDTVKPGDVLAILGTPSEGRQLEILSNQVVLAAQNAGENSAALRELESKIKLSRQRYRQDSVTAARYQDLAQDKAVSAKEAEQAQLQAESSLIEHMNLQQQYQTQKNELSNRLLSAKQQLAQHNQSREGKVLASPIHGKVYSVHFEENELVQPGEPVLMVGLADKFKLELLVDERDINKIKLGQKVYFETDAFDGQQFEAKVQKIVRVLQKDTRSFQVEAEVLSQEEFYPQASVEANIVIREDIKALVVPTDYILPGDSVKVQQGDGAQVVKIATGTRNGEWMEVKSGLKAGDVILKEE